MFSTGLFIDNFGGFPSNELVMIFGESRSGKTFFSLLFSLRFLESFPFGYVIYFDCDQSLRHFDIVKLANKYNVPITLLSKIYISLATSNEILMSDLKSFIEEKMPEQVFVIIDSLPNLFIGELDKYVMKEHRLKNILSGVQRKSYYIFLENIKKFLKNNFEEYYLLITNQVRSIVDENKELPLFWRNLKIMPAYWGSIHMIVDTLIYVKRIYHNSMFLKIVFSNSLPEVSGIIKIL